MAGHRHLGGREVERRLGHRRGDRQGRLRGGILAEFRRQGSAGALAGDGDELRALRLRHVGALRQHAAQLRILLGPRRQDLEAAGREPGALVARDAAHHLLVAPRDDDVGDALGQRAAAREGHQVLLPGAARDLDEVALLEAVRALEHGAGHLRGGIVGEVAHHPARGIGHVREVRRQFGSGAGLDVAREPQDHLVEGADLILAEPRRLRREQARHLAQHADALGRVATRDGALDIVHHRTEREHADVLLTAGGMSRRAACDSIKIDLGQASTRQKSSFCARLRVQF
nr:hypothetical protein [Methylobacterium durans]